MQKEQKTKAIEILSKHLMDNVIIHSDDEFIEASGPRTKSAKTVTYSDNTNNDSHFIIKYEGLKSTITEVMQAVYIKHYFTIDLLILL
ncbi:hypothetical protein [Candidatus Mesenet endosymbiont of Phosphuga atrata]|uniref:hypothetical protein n=1 Tax=Candidatus Mesenet endosymbiont of Phosphuga atrata TaxID=3066221 RepID=UPI0030CFC447